MCLRLGLLVGVVVARFFSSGRNRKKKIVAQKQVVFRATFAPLLDEGKQQDSGPGVKNSVLHKQTPKLRGRL